MEMLTEKQLSRVGIFAFAIVALSFLLRITSTFSLPSLNWDEVSHGYNAYSILTSGRDEWGVQFPVIFQAFGDYKLPVYIYLTSIAELLFGLTTLSVRYVSILAGTLLVLFTYLLGKRLFNPIVGLLAAATTALSPWSLFLSLGAFEANLGQLFVVSATYLFLTASKPWRLLASSVLFGLSVWTYNSERVFVPLLIVILAILYKKEIQKISLKNFFGKFSLIVLAIFLIPMVYQLIFANVGSARYKSVEILDQGAINTIEGLRQNSSSEYSRLIYNKVTFFASKFAQNYISHFSPDFLFLKGGNNYQFNVQNHGLLYLIDVLPILVGLIYLVKNRSKTEAKLILAWLLLAPIPSSLTREAPHTLRAITFLPIPMIISAIGVVEIWRWWFKRVKVRLLRNQPIALYAIFFGYLTVSYLTLLFYNYSKTYSQSWQYGYKQAVEYTRLNYNEYDQVIITKKYGEPHEFFLFYWPWNPELFRTDKNLVRYGQSNWFWVDSFDKFYFVNDWDIPKNEKGEWKTERKANIDVSKNTLLITAPNNYPPGWKKLETIYFLDGDIAFEILNNEKN